MSESPTVAENHERRLAARSPSRRLLVVVAVLAGVLIPLFAWMSGAKRDPIAEFVQKGDAQLRAGEPERAVASYERALAAADLLLAGNPASDLRMRTLLLRAQVLERLGRRQQALAAYQALACEFPEVASDIAPKLQPLDVLSPEVIEALHALAY